MDKNTIITTIYVIVDTICKNLLTPPPQKQKLNDAEIITITICSALFFNSNHDKALSWLWIGGYFSDSLSLSRFNRRMHGLKNIIAYCMEKTGELFLTKDSYIQDSMPLPVCKRARACRNKKVRGKEYCGYCAAKKEKFFGFRLHMVTDFNGIPVSVCILPGALHDLDSVYEITYPLPDDSKVIGDKGYTCSRDERGLKECGINLMPIRRKNQKNQWPLWDELFIKENRHQIETSFSLLSDVMGLNRLKARTLDGFFIKTYAGVLALLFHIVLLIQ